jgi:hypothetical protein
VKYTIARRDDSVNVAVFVDGQWFNADENHPNIDAIVSAIATGETENLVSLFDVTTALTGEFERLSEVVSTANGRVYVDGDEVDGPYAEQIVRFVREGADYGPLVKFLEKVFTNTDAHTRENLSRWLDATHGFTIDSDGDIVGYKGVRADGTSIHAGGATVDGKEVKGNVPNEVGSVIELPRSKVTHDPNRGCAAGLHVGTWEYASGFGQRILTVKVNPRDVVSVPTECGSQKMRVCRYKVTSITEAKHDTAYTDDYDYDEEDACEFCGDPDCYEDC